MQPNITRDNILMHIIQKRRELEELEKMNNEMMHEAQKRASSGGRRKDLKKFKAKVARNSFGSSPSTSPHKDKLE
jgi:hypothetical protein